MKKSMVSLVAVAALATAANAATETTIKGYGSIRVDSISNSKEFNSAQAAILVQKQPAGRTPGREFNIHPRLTRLGVMVERYYPQKEVTVNGRVEVDFQNGGLESRELLRLRHGYVSLSRGNFEVLAGQTWQTVSRLMPLANGDTIMWGAGNTGDRSPQLRISYGYDMSEKQHFDFEVAAQQIGTVENKGQVGTNFGSAPAYQARIAFQSASWTKTDLHIALGYHTAEEVLAEKGFGEDTFDQEGVFVEAILPVVDGLSVHGEYFSGKNISDLRGGILLGLNPVTDEEIETAGYWAEARVDMVEDMTFSLGYGIDDPDDDQVVAGYPSENEAAWAVAHYQFLPDMRLGLEYIEWSTEYKDDQRLKSERVNAHVKWDF